MAGCGHPAGYSFSPHPLRVFSLSNPEVKCAALSSRPGRVFIQGAMLTDSLCEKDRIAQVQREATVVSCSVHMQTTLTAEDDHQSCHGKRVQCKSSY